MNKYTSNSSKFCVLEVDLEYPKELRDLHIDYPLASDEVEYKKKKKKTCYLYQLMISEFYSIPIGNVKKLLANFFDKENCVLHYENL